MNASLIKLGEWRQLHRDVLASVNRVNTGRSGSRILTRDCTVQNQGTVKAKRSYSETHLQNLDNHGTVLEFRLNSRCFCLQCKYCAIKTSSAQEFLTQRVLLWKTTCSDQVEPSHSET